MIWRVEGSSKAPKREIKLLGVLMMVHTQVWKAVFGKPADALERSVENPDECELFCLKSNNKWSLNLLFQI